MQGYESTNQVIYWFILTTPANKQTATSCCQFMCKIHLVTKSAQGPYCITWFNSSALFDRSHSGMLFHLFQMVDKVCFSMPFWFPAVQRLTIVLVTTKAFGKGVLLFVTTAF